MNKFDKPIVPFSSFKLVQPDNFSKNHLKLLIIILISDPQHLGMLFLSDLQLPNNLSLLGSAKERR